MDQIRTVSAWSLAHVYVDPGRWIIPGNEVAFSAAVPTKSNPHFPVLIPWHRSTYQQFWLRSFFWDWEGLRSFPWDCTPIGCSRPIAACLQWQGWTKMHTLLRDQFAISRKKWQMAIKYFAYHRILYYLFGAVWSLHGRGSQGSTRRW